MRARWTVAVLICAVACTSCSSAASQPAPRVALTASPNHPTRAAVSAVPIATGHTAARRVTKVLTIVEENHGTAAVNRNMPYLTALGRRYGRTTNYRALTHPSLPNYLALAGGSTFGVHDDASSSTHPIAGPSVFDEALATHHTAAGYAESMSRPCGQVSSGRYAARHNPWTYFTGRRKVCLAHDVPAGTVRAGALHDAIISGRLPNVGMLIPDLCHDAHDCSLAIADSWLRSWMTLIAKSPDWRSGRLAVVVTFDEAEGGGNVSSGVLTVVASPALRSKVVTTALNHLSWSRWMSELVGATPLHGARTATSLGRTFGL